MDKIEAPWDRLEKILKSLSVKDLIYYESILIYVFKMPDLQASLIIVFFIFSLQCQMKAKFSHWLIADRVRNSL